MDTVSSWRLKVERAKQHFAALETETIAWLATKPIAMTKEKDVEGRRHALVAEIVNPPPLDRWALISGDCVHNLRSALDSLLYGIAIHETGLNPPKDEARLQFPITSSPEKFEEQKNRIRTLSVAVQLEIENVQPYNNPHPEFPPVLELLGSLDNFDKHRTLNVVAAVPHAASIYDMACAPTIVSVYRTIITGKTEVLSFTIEPPNPSLVYKYEATIVICVAHPPGPSKSPFSQLAAVLASLIEEVERIVTTLQRVVGPMQNPVSVNLSQASHFKIDKAGATVVKAMDQMGATP
jgi:hypothetical protein